MVRRYATAAPVEATADLLVDVVVAAPHVAKRRLAHADGARRGSCAMRQGLSEVEAQPVVVAGDEARAEQPASAAADRRRPGRRGPAAELDVTTDRRH